MERVEEYMIFIRGLEDEPLLEEDMIYMMSIRLGRRL